MASFSLLSKILLASLLISIAIRQLGPQLAIAATSVNATFAILLPSIAVAIFLGWRGWKPQAPSDS